MWKVGLSSKDDRFWLNGGVAQLGERLVRKPPLPASRERRLDQGEFAALRAASSRGTNPWIWPMAELAQLH